MMLLLQLWLSLQQLLTSIVARHGLGARVKGSWSIIVSAWPWYSRTLAGVPRICNPCKLYKRKYDRLPALVQTATGCLVRAPKPPKPIVYCANCAKVTDKDPRRSTSLPGSPKLRCACSQWERNHNGKSRPAHPYTRERVVRGLRTLQRAADSICYQGAVLIKKHSAYSTTVSARPRICRACHKHE